MKEMIHLPDPAGRNDARFADVLVNRQTVREFSPEPLALETVSRLLFAAQGEVDGRRTAPSAGAFYPVQLFLAARQVAGLDNGVYAYMPDGGALACTRSADVSAALEAAALEEQSWVGKSAAVIAIVADVAAACEKFHEQPPEGERGARYAHMEAGAIAQNLYLQCAASGIAGVLVAGFRDDAAKAALQLPGNLKPLILFCVGNSVDAGTPSQGTS